MTYIDKCTMSNSVVSICTLILFQRFLNFLPRSVSSVRREGSLNSTADCRLESGDDLVDERCLVKEGGGV